MIFQRCLVPLVAILVGCTFLLFFKTLLHSSQRETEVEDYVDNIRQDISHIDRQRRVLVKRAQQQAREVSEKEDSVRNRIQEMHISTLNGTQFKIELLVDEAESLTDEDLALKSELQALSSSVRKTRVNGKTPQNKILLIQTSLPEKRSTIHNKDFELFEIRSDVFVFRGTTHANNCKASEKTRCNLQAMFDILSSIPQPDFYYVIEDDTYFCGSMSRLEELMRLGLPIVTTGIGGSGILFQASMLEKFRLEKRPASGFDLLIYYYFLDQTYRYYLNINVHLYQGSVTPGHTHGQMTQHYPVCFEFSCQQKNVGGLDWYNFIDCAEVVHKSNSPNCFASSGPPVNDVPVCGRFCKERCDWQKFKWLPARNK
jgi:hypothetical protein